MSYFFQTNMTECVFLEKKYFTKKKKSYFKYISNLKNIKDFSFEKGSFFKKKLISLKQIRFFYGYLSAATFKKFVFFVSKFSGNKNQNLLSFLELRLQTFVYRLNWSRTIFHSKNLIASKTFFVNGAVTTAPNYILNVGDIVSFSVFKQDQYGAFFEKMKLSANFFSKNINYAATDYALGVSVLCCIPDVSKMKFPTYLLPSFAFLLSFSVLFTFFQVFVLLKIN